MLKVLAKKLKTFLGQNREDLLVIVLFLLLPVLAFWRNFDFSGLNLTFFDAEFIGAYYPDFLMGSHIFSTMKDVLWDPHNFLGIPLIGGVDRIGIFYPVKIAFYLISVLVAQKHLLFLATYFPLFHLSVAGCTMYFLLTRYFKLSKFAAFVAGVVYAFNGSLIHFVQYPNHPVGPAFLPITLYFLFKTLDEKRYKYAIWAGVTMAPVLLSGYTPAFIYSNLFVFLLLLLLYTRDFKSLKRVVYALIICNATAFILSLPELLPNFENASFSARQKFNLTGSSANSFSFMAVIYYVFPYLYGYTGSSNFVYGYVGIVPLLLAGIALVTDKRTITRSLLLLIFFFLLLSFGHSVFLHQAVYLAVPKFAYFRLPAYMHYVIGFALAVLAGFGVKAMEKKAVLPAWVQEVIKKATFLLVSVILAAYLLKAAFYQSAILDTVIKSVVFTGIIYAAGLILLRLTFSSPKNKLIQVLLVSLILLDLFTLISAHDYTNSPRDPRIFNGENAVTVWLKEHTQNDYTRVFMHELSARYNAKIFGLYQPGGYGGLYPETYGYLLNPFVDSVYGIDPRSGLFDMMNVKYYASSLEVDILPNDTLKKVLTYEVQPQDLHQFIDKDANPLTVGTKFNVYENTNVLPRAFFVSRLKVIDESEVGTVVIDDLDFSREAVVTIVKADSENRKKAERSFNSPFLSTAKVLEYTGEKVTFQTSSVDDGFMVFSDTYYPGWEAYVDGKKQDIIKTNLYVRGLFIDRGVHRVEF
ncbi:YfhO family protein, partial [Patescibacteria group bacterium]|nr:YfhO family protein [Patescibacteria group bacterium]